MTSPPKRPKAPPDPLRDPVRVKIVPPKPPVWLLSFDDPLAQEKWQAELAEWRKQVNGDVFLQTMSKVRPLLDHYELNVEDEHRWLKLALFLARDYVPGFQVAPPEKRKGRPEKWDDVALAKLHCSVATLHMDRRTKGLASSDLDACRVLAKRPEWAGYGGAKALANQLSAAKVSPLVRFVEAARADPRIGDRAYALLSETLDLPK